MESFLVIIVVCGLFSYILIPITIRIAHHIKAVSYPGTRHIHKKVMPLLGGIAIYCAFIFGFLLFSKDVLFSAETLQRELPALLIASSITIIVGIIDDIAPIKTRPKLFSQLLVAMIIVYYGNLTIDSIFGFLPDKLDFQLANLLTLFWIVSVINAVNLVDGLNGLSTGIGIIFFATILVLYLLGGTASMFALIISSTMLGALIGFLPWNFPRARVFMGDTGSMFLGLIIAVVPLLGFKQVTVVTLFLPILMIIFPVFEIFTTVFRRLLSRQSLAKADDRHTHHYLLKITNSSVKAVLIIWGVSILFAINAILFEIGNIYLAWIMFVILVVLAFYTYIKTR